MTAACPHCHCQLADGQPCPRAVAHALAASERDVHARAMRRALFGSRPASQPQQRAES